MEWPKAVYSTAEIAEMRRGFRVIAAPSAYLCDLCGSRIGRQSRRVRTRPPPLSSESAERPYMSVLTF